MQGNGAELNREGSVVNTPSGAADLQRWRAPPVYRLLSPGSLLEGNHQHKVWRGIAQTPGSHEPGMPLVFKWSAKPAVLAAELACALAARALRLQVPVGVLVLAQKDQLPGLPARVRGKETDVVICFGSELQWPDDTLARPTGEEAAAEWTWQKLCDTPQGPAGGVWDELVANDDRHSNNAVFDGNRWWLIDHEFAIAPLAKVMTRFAEQVTRQSVIEHRAPVNILADQVLQRRRNDHKMEQLPAAWSTLRNRLQWIITQAQQWRTPHEQLNTVLMMTEIYLRSIDLRLPALALHLQRRMRIPESTALWTSSNSPKTKPPSRRTLRRPT